MAIAPHRSTPAQATGIAGSATTASFTAPANARIVVTVAANNNTPGADITATVSDTGGLSWSPGPERDQGDGGAQNGHASIWIASPSTEAPRTITASCSATGGVVDVVLNAFVFTGVDAIDPIGASGEGSSTTKNITPSAFTAEAANSFMVAVGSDWNATGSPTSSDLVRYSYHNALTFSAIAGYKPMGAADAKTVNLNAGGAGPAWNWAAIEIKAASLTAPVAWVFA